VFHRTTCVDVVDPTVTVDEYGDDVEAWDTSDAGIGAHIHEKTFRAYNAAEARWTTTRGMGIMCDRGTALEKGSRIRERSTGYIYVVEHVYDHDQSPAGYIPVRADITRITG
jgi:hypothetical protein